MVAPEGFASMYSAVSESGRGVTGAGQALGANVSPAARHVRPDGARQAFEGRQAGAIY